MIDVHDQVSSIFYQLAGVRKPKVRNRHLESK